MVIRLIDTDVLVDHLRGRSEAFEFLTARRAAGDQLLCSVVTHAELFAGMRPGEEPIIRSLLSALVAVAIDAAIAEVAGTYRRTFGKSHGLLLPDALIAGTAKLKGAMLATTNTKHYPMEDLSVGRPY